MNTFHSIGVWLATIAVSISAFFGAHGGVATKQDVVNIQPTIVQEDKISPEIMQYITRYIENSMKSGQILGSTLPIAGVTYNLSGSGVSSNASSITLQSLTIPQTGQKIVDADLGDTFYITLEPGNRTKQEIVGCTTLVQNANGTATVSSCSRGLSPISPYTASTTLAFVHAGSAQVIFSNPPQFYNQFTAKANSETIAGEWTFGINPHGTTATSSNQLVTLGQASAIASQGAATSTESVGGLVELGTIAEQASSFDGGVAKPTVLQTKNSTSTCQVVGSYTIVASTTTGKLDKGCFDQTLNYSLTGLNTFLGSTTMATTTYAGPQYSSGVFADYLSSSTITIAPPKAVFASSTGAIELTNPAFASSTEFIGFAITGASVGGTTTVQTTGVVSGFTGLTKGAKYYASATAGSISTATSTIGTIGELYVGKAINSTQLLITSDPNAPDQFIITGNGAVSGAFGTSTAPDIARKAIVQYQASGNYGGNTLTTRGELTVYRFGQTTAINQDIITTGSPLSALRIDVTWTGNNSIVTKVTASNGSSPSADSSNANFYR